MAFFRCDPLQPDILSSLWQEKILTGDGGVELYQFLEFFKVSAATDMQGKMLTLWGPFIQPGAFDPNQGQRLLTANSTLVLAKLKRGQPPSGAVKMEVVR